MGHSPEDHQPDQREYPLSAAEPCAAAGLSTLALIAPGLGEAQLRCYIALAAEALKNDRHTARMSSRTLAERTGLARSNVQRAIDELTERRLISTRQGSPTTTAGYLVHALSLVPMGGPTAGPPPTAQVASQQGHPTQQGGPIAGPPPHDNAPRAPAFGTSKIDSIDLKIDRVLTAKAEEQNPAEIEGARRHIESLYRHTHQWRGSAVQIDDDIVAQVLTAAGSVQQVQALCQALRDERREAGDNGGWIVTVAISRFLKVKPDKIAERRATLKAQRRGPQTEQRAVGFQSAAEILKARSQHS